MPTLQPEVLGVTFDGVKILKPVTEPTSFTVGEIRETVSEVMRAHYRELNVEHVAALRGLPPQTNI